MKSIVSCKNCGHTICLQESFGINKARWYHILSKAHGSIHHGKSWGSCDCENAEPKEDTSSIPRNTKDVAYS